MSAMSEERNSDMDDNIHRRLKNVEADIKDMQTTLNEITAMLRKIRGERERSSGQVRMDVPREGQNCFERESDVHNNGEGVPILFFDDEHHEYDENTSIESTATGKPLEKIMNCSRARYDYETADRMLKREFTGMRLILEA
uniref:Uncharacterized protein n=1 Tax=Strongyloides stercoralis TaxID=6248 RepID=A0AAF5DHS8_STRER